MPAVSEQEEFEFRRRAEQESHAGMSHTPGAERPDVIGELGDTAADVALGFAGTPVDVGNQTLNLGRAAVGSVGRATGLMSPGQMPNLVDPANQPGSSAWLQNWARDNGLISRANDPTTQSGRVARSALSGALGAALGGKVGISPAIRNAIGGAASGLGAGAVNESNLDGSSKGLASAAAALLPGMGAQSRSAMMERIRKAIVGNTDVAGKVQTARDAGIKNPDPAAVTGSKGLAGVQGAFSRLPGGTGVMDKAAEARIEGVQGRVKEIARALNPSGPVNAERAGAELQTGIHGDVTRMRGVQKSLYDKVDAVVPSDTQIPMTKFRAALREFAAPVKGAEAMSAQLVPGKVKSLHEALETDLSAIPEKQEPEGPPPVSSKPAALPDLAELLRIFENPPAKPAPATPPKVMRPVTTERRNGDHIQRIDRQIEVKDTAAREAKDTMPYEAVSGIRSQLGRLLESPGMLTDAPKNEYKALYRALTEDIRGGLPPNARQTWDRASKYTRAMHDRVDSVYEPLERAGTPEKAVTAALSGTNAGASAFRKVMGSLTPPQANAVAAHVVEKMGTARPGQQDAEGGRFSIETFATNWAKMSDGARRALFKGRTYDDMKTIAQAASDMRSAGQGTQNASGTGRAVAHVGFYGAAASQIVSGLVSGNVGQAAKVGAAFAGEAALNHAVARALTSPKFVQWLADGTKPAAADAGSYVGRLLAIQKTERDPETQAALGDVAQAVGAAPVEAQ